MKSTITCFNTQHLHDALLMRITNIISRSDDTGFQTACQAQHYSVCARVNGPVNAAQNHGYMHTDWQRKQSSTWLCRLTNKLWSHVDFSKAVKRNGLKSDWCLCLFKDLIRYSVFVFHFVGKFCTVIKCVVIFEQQSGIIPL